MKVKTKIGFKFSVSKGFILEKIKHLAFIFSWRYSPVEILPRLFNLSSGSSTVMMSSSMMSGKKSPILFFHFVDFTRKLCPSSSFEADTYSTAIPNHNCMLYNSLIWYISFWLLNYIRAGSLAVLLFCHTVILSLCQSVCLTAGWLEATVNILGSPQNENRCINQSLKSFCRCSTVWPVPDWYICSHF